MIPELLEVLLSLHVGAGLDLYSPVLMEPDAQGRGAGSRVVMALHALRLLEQP